MSQLAQSPLAKFIKRNHQIVMEYHKRHYKTIKLFDKTPYGKVKSLIKSALIASGSPLKLAGMLECLNRFTDETTEIEKANAMTFKTFARCFYKEYAGPENIDQLSSALEDLPQIGPKKANLFLKELVLLGDKDIFGDDFNSKDFTPFLKVPIDKVLRRIYCKLHRKDFPEKREHRYDNDINSFAKKLFPNSPILFDDIWFWAHFTFIRDEFSPINEALLYCDPLMDIEFIKGNKLEDKLKEFHKIVINFDPGQY